MDFSRFGGHFGTILELLGVSVGILKQAISITSSLLLLVDTTAMKC